MPGILFKAKHFYTLRISGSDPITTDIVIPCYNLSVGAESEQRFVEAQHVVHQFQLNNHTTCVRGENLPLYFEGVEP